MSQDRISPPLECEGIDPETAPLLSDDLDNASRGPPTAHDHDFEAAENLLDQKPHSFADTATWTAELWLLFSYSVPLIGTYLLQYFYSVVTIFVAGHIGSDAFFLATVDIRRCQSAQHQRVLGIRLVVATTERRSDDIHGRCE